MKKALLLGILFIFGCETAPTVAETAKKTVSTARVDLYVIRCPLSSTSVNWIRRSGKFSYPETTVTIEDTVPKEDPELTALKEKAEKLGFEVKKK
jgi:hypothetical protein